MLAKTCPKCKKPLGSYDNYFCSSCGKKLPEDLIQVPNALKVRTYVPAEEVKIKKHVKFSAVRDYIISAFLIIFIAFVGIWISGTGIVELVTIKTTESGIQPTPQAPQKESKVLSLDSALEFGQFGEYNFEDKMFESTQFYMEGNDLAGYLELVGQEDLSSKANLLLEPDFAVFIFEENWNLLVVPKDFEILEAFLDSYENENWHTGEINGEYLLISEDEEIFEKLDPLLTNLEKSLSQNPDYVKLSQNLEEDGKLKIVFLDNSSRDLIKNSLAGLDQEIIANINKIILFEGDSFTIN